jgi:hypothetical protein
MYSVIRRAQPAIAATCAILYGQSVIRHSFSST